jgi:hypothetical protein
MGMGITKVITRDLSRSAGEPLAVGLRSERRGGTSNLEHPTLNVEGEGKSLQGAEVAEEDGIWEFLAAKKAQEGRKKRGFWIWACEENHGCTRMATDFRGGGLPGAGLIFDDLCGSVKVGGR